MKSVKKIVLTMLFGTMTVGVNAQFTLSGEIRPRAEYRNGFKTLMDSAQSNAFFVDQRTRINAGYKVDDYEFYVTLQDYRVWGSTAQLNTSDGFLAIHEAWAKANFNKNLGLKLGRQEIAYDDHRIFGNVGWAQQARSHDAALLQYSKDKTKLDLGIAFNQAGAGLTGTGYTGPSSYRDMYYAYFNQKINDKIQTSWLFMGLGREAAPDIYTYQGTFGTHSKFKFGSLSLDFNGFYQFGSDNTTFDFVDDDGVFDATHYKSFSAYLIGLDLNYKVSDAFSVGLGYETQSGNSGPGADNTKNYYGTNRAFNPWFGTNHKFNGFMDYFYVGNWGNSVGLQDINLKLKYKMDKWSFGLDAHMFMMGLGAELLDNDKLTSDEIKQGTILDPLDYKYASNLGTEIDLSIATKINSSVTLKAGYSYMMGTPTLYNLKGVQYYNLDPTTGDLNARELPSNMWGYVMVIFKPTFIDGKDK